VVVADRRRWPEHPQHRAQAVGELASLVPFAVGGPVAVAVGLGGVGPVLVRLGEVAQPVAVPVLPENGGREQEPNQQ